MYDNACVMIRVYVSLFRRVRKSANSAFWLHCICTPVWVALSCCIKSDRTERIFVKFAIEVFDSDLLRKSVLY